MATPAWRRYLRFWAPNVDGDVDDELRFHIESRVQEYLTLGMDRRTAEEETMRRFGDVAQVRDSCRRIGHEWERQMRMSELVESVVHDLRYALRQLARSRGFALATVLTLALGIGANASLFSVIDAILLRPLPGIREPERLVVLSNRSIAYPVYQDFRDAAKGTIELAAFRERPMALGDGSRAELVTGSTVSGNYFRVMGARAAVGRLLLPDDDRPGAPAIAVLGHGFWTRFLGGDRGVLGRTITINGAPVTIVGVAAPDFRGTRVVGVPDLYIPISSWPDVAPTSFSRLDHNQRTWSWLIAIGRLAPGATIAQAKAALDASYGRQREIYPDQTQSTYPIELDPAALAVAGMGTRGPLVQFMTLLGTVVAIVLLIACANVANLLVARASHRRREIGVRLALGAGRRRLVRQLLTETLVLWTIAGATGLAVAWVGIGLLGRISLPGQLSLSGLDLSIDGRLVAFTLLLTLITGGIFGLMPAVQASRHDIVSAVKDGVPTDARGQSRLRGTLLVAQVAMSLVLLVGAGLFVRSLQRALSIDVGFDATRTALASVDLGLARYDTARAGRYYAEVERRVAAIPGVRAVTWTNHVPLSADYNTETFRIVGVETPDGEESEVGVVGTDFHALLGVKIAAGRAFAPGDARGAEPVVIINETMAKRFWPGRSPLGARLQIMGGELAVVGVAADIKHHELQEEPRSFVYGALPQAIANAGLSPMTLMVKTAGDPEAALGAIRREIERADRGVPIFETRVFGDQLDALLFPQRFGAALLGVFSVLALVVAAVGIYGVVAYAVARRTREIGIRMALGARPLVVLGLIMRENLRLVVIGVVIGLGIAATLSRGASAFLYGVSATDLGTFTLMAGILLAVSALAAYLPARRATRVDPLTALRSD